MLQIVCDKCGGVCGKEGAVNMKISYSGLGYSFAQTHNFHWCKSCAEASDLQKEVKTRESAAERLEDLIAEIATEAAVEAVSNR